METPSDGIKRRLRILFIVFVYGILFAGGHWGGGWLIDFFSKDIAAIVEGHEAHVLMGGIALFIILMAAPFMPGIEISLGLLALFGPKAAVPVFAATVVALTLSWLIGRTLPISLIAALFRALGLQRAKALVQRLQPLNAEQRFEVLIDHAPRRIIPMLLKRRYIALVIALNIPGNAVIGGGGGIALLAGMSGLFTFPLFLFSVSLAALPVPLFVLLSGS